MFLIIETRNGDMLYYSDTFATLIDKITKARAEGNCITWVMSDSADSLGDYVDNDFETI